MKKIILILVLIIGCSNNHKELLPEEIALIDNYLVNHNVGIKYIDSLLDIYPDSEYLHGIKIMYFANKGMYKKAFNYQNNIARDGIYGTFTTMGWAQSYKLLQERKYNLLLSTNIDSFKESIKLDTHYVNIWARVELADIYLKKGTRVKAEDLLLDAYNINPTNSYVLEKLTKFYLLYNQKKEAKKYFNKINPNFKPKDMKKLREEIETYN